MTQIEVVKVVMHYTVQGNAVSARVREYAGGVAFRESSVDMTEGQLAEMAKGPAWDETHVVQQAGADLWIGDKDGLKLAQDVLSPADMGRISSDVAQDVIAELNKG